MNGYSQPMVKRVKSTPEHTNNGIPASNELQFLTRGMYMANLARNNNFNYYSTDKKWSEGTNFCVLNDLNFNLIQQTEY